MNPVKFSFLLALLFCFAPAFSQDIIDEIAQETCDCVSKKNLDNLNEEQLQMELGMCMMTSLGSRPDAMKDLGVDISDQASMTKFGEQIGMRMVTKCPTILMRLGAMTTETETKVTQGGEVTGVIRGFAGDEFRYVILVDESGREHRLLWLRYFPGSESLVNDPGAIIGKQAVVRFELIECFSPKANEYISRREIRQVEIRN